MPVAIFSLFDRLEDRLPKTQPRQAGEVSGF